MTSLVIALETRVEDRLISDILERGNDILARASTASELTAAVEQCEPEAVIVSASKKYLTETVIAACDARGVRLIALAGGDFERRNATALGIYEVIDENAPWEDIAHLLHVRVTFPMSVDTAGQHEPRHARTIAVWGPSGAPGRTTVAINLAAELAARGYAVALADVDTYGGAIAPALGLLDEAPGFAAACRLAATDSLTQHELERVSQRYKSQNGAFWVLTGISRSSRWPELTAERVTKTIESCSRWVDYVIVDTGFSVESDEEISSDLFAPRRNAATLAVLRAAAHIVMVGLADPVGISRFLRAHVDLLDIVPDTARSIIINRVRASAVGFNPKAQISSTLARFGGIHNATLIPEDRACIDAAVLSGQSLFDVAPKSPARARIADFTESALLGVSESSRHQRKRRASPQPTS